MAPSASDPKELKLALNPARQRAFTLLVGSLVGQMRKNIEYTFDQSPKDAAPLFATRDPPRDRTISPERSSNPSEEGRQQRLEAKLERSPSTPKLQALKRDALRYFDKWANEVRVELRRITDSPEDPRSEQRRREWLQTRNVPPPPYTSTDTVFESAERSAAAQATEARKTDEAKDVSMLHSLYPPTPTRFTTISKEDRVCVISCMALLLLSLGHYSAYSRTLLCYLTSSFHLPMAVLTTEENEISKTLLLASKTLTADAETKKRQVENASSRRWKVGLASLGGAALIGITGGLAAPVVAGAIGGLMGGVGLGGVASFLGIFAMNGALVGTLFGAFGGKMTGEMVDAYAKEVSDFKFIPIAEEWGEHTSQPLPEEETRRLRVTIGINGWLNTKEDIVRPWRVLGRDSETFALRYEIDALLELGNSLKDMVSSYAWSFVKVEILKRTVLATLLSALWPVYLLKMATSLDTPFAVAKHRSEKAGAVLADALINKAQGERPVTLIGYSLGARVIYSCLKSLAQRRAFGLVENVILIGSPIPSNSDNWREMRAVVSGKVINVYSENDYILAFLYRATSVQYGVAGLQGIKGVEGIGNEDLTKDVSGHLRYPELVGKILKRVGVEHVNVEDETIEMDAEIKVIDNEDLIDFGDDSGIDSNPSNAGGFTMMDDSPVWPGSSTEKTIPQTFGGMKSQPTNGADYSGVLFEHSSNTDCASSSFAREPISTTTPIPNLVYYFSETNLCTPPNEESRPSQPSTTSAPSNIPLFSPQTSQTRQSQHDIEEENGYSSSNDGGIQMEDNDEPLDILDAEPIPDNYEFQEPTPVASTRPTRNDLLDGNDGGFQEQKVLRGHGENKAAKDCVKSAA
ncbi:hypothetical protein HYFRA_00006751 [Hymenoscyphus fraxineus]|uniref:DUF726-domain-containing protein n=1 Tax=Hymenoscyphus fraxineus TaxID=746836 RepID=A0A9N9PSW5_9HELO|nr:hypothetical protein HYFRA_00006751 [Hymenoscyphus fraxineus]